MRAASRRRHCAIFLASLGEPAVNLQAKARRLRHDRPGASLAHLVRRAADLCGRRIGALHIIQPQDLFIACSRAANPQRRHALRGEPCGLARRLKFALLQHEAAKTA